MIRSSLNKTKEKKKPKEKKLPTKTVWNKIPKEEKVVKVKKLTQAQTKSLLKKWVNKLDILMSKYIRMKYAGKDGMVECVSCGKILHWKECHCAHYIKRAKMWTRFLEENLNVACPYCNTYNQEFHMKMYTIKLIKQFGLAFVEELIILGNNIKQRKVYELEELYEKYKPLVKKLEWSLHV